MGKQIRARAINKVTERNTGHDRDAVEVVILIRI